MSNVNNPPIPRPTTQRDVTASRAVDGTVYQNTRAVPIYVLVVASVATPSSGHDLNLFISSQNPPNATLVDSSSGGISAIRTIGQSVSSWVLPGYYYCVIATAGLGLAIWTEYD